MFPILPQDAASNALGPFPPELPSDVAKADNQAIDDLNQVKFSLQSHGLQKLELRIS